jgi:hypothetical protein
LRLATLTECCAMWKESLRLGEGFVKSHPAQLNDKGFARDGQNGMMAVWAQKENNNDHWGI